MVEDLLTAYTAKFFSVSNEEVKTEISVLVFPNPSSDFLTITQPDFHAIKRLELYRLNGQKVLIEEIIGKSRIIQLNIRHLENGSYLLKCLTDGNEVLVKQIIKN